MRKERKERSLFLKGGDNKKRENRRAKNKFKWL